MPDLAPFRGIRYAAAADLKDLVCPPYDIISPAEQQQLHERDPHNAVRIELAKDAGDPSDPDRYRDVGRAFQDWLSEDVLEVDEQPSYYVYRQDFTKEDGTRARVTGVIGALGLEPFGADSGVLPHERTMEGPKADRLALLHALQVNVSPIYAIYRGGGGLGPYYDSLENRPTAARFADDDGILHRLWVVDSPAEVEMLRAVFVEGPLVIADGHHRYETALTFHGEAPDLPGAEAIMCFCVDADAEDLVVLPYNRVLKTAAAVDTEAAVASSGAPVEGSPEGALGASGSDHPFVFVTAGGLRLIEVEDDEVRGVVGERAKAWRDLDVVALHEVLLPRLFPEGVEELAFTKDPDKVVEDVLVGHWDAGVLLRPLDAAQIVDVARSGERMPQKASYFWPKAVTGLVFRSLS